MIYEYKYTPEGGEAELQAYRKKVSLLVEAYPWSEFYKTLSNITGSYSPGQKKAIDAGIDRWRL